MLNQKAILLLAILVLVVPLAAAASQDGELAGSCPDDFTLQAVGHCTCEQMGGSHGHGSHVHAGTSIDRNDDGWICMKHVSNDDGVHVHIDNNKKKATPADAASSRIIELSVLLLGKLLSLVG